MSGELGVSHTPGVLVIRLYMNAQSEDKLPTTVFVTQSLTLHKPLPGVPGESAMRPSIPLVCVGDPLPLHLEMQTTSYTSKARLFDIPALPLQLTI